MVPSHSTRRLQYAGAVICALFIIGASNAARGTAAPQAEPGQGSDRAAALRDIDAVVTRALKMNVSPGLAVAIVVGSDVVYAQGAGVTDVGSRRPVTADTPFYIASTTKSFTALAGAILAERKAIDLDWPLSRALPGVVLHPQLSADAITLRDLLTHTHGIAGGPVELRTAFTGDFTNALLLDILKVHGPSGRGKTFAYSNLGYNIFGLVLDQHYTEGWQQVLQREVFDPLGMRDTTASMSKVDPATRAEPHELGADGPERIAYAKEDSNMQAAGGHVTTASDLARYLVAEMNGGRVGERQVIPEAAIRETQRQQVGQNRNVGPFHRFGAGLGWDLATYDGDTVLQRFGGFQGFNSHLSFMPGHRIGVVVLANGGAASTAITDWIASYAYDRLRGKPGGDPDAGVAALAVSVDRGRAASAQGIATRRARSQTTPLPRDAYAGTYESPILGRMVWTMTDGLLRVQMGVARSEAEVYDGARHQWRVELTGGGTVVTFDVPDGAARPTGLQFMNFAFTRVQ